MRSSSGWLVSSTLYECLQRQITQKIFKLKIQAPLSTLVSTWRSNIAFHLQVIWLQNVLAINLESRLTSFPSFCAQSSEVAVLFYSNLSRCPFLEQVVDLDLLLCTGFNLEDAVLFQCHILTQRPKADRKIERSDGCCFGWQQLLANSIEIFISMKKKVISCCPNSQSIKTCPRLTMPVLG